MVRSEILIVGAGIGGLALAAACEPDPAALLAGTIREQIGRPAADAERPHVITDLAR